MDIEQLEKLKELKDKGILTEEEFDAKKTDLLKGEPKPHDINNNYVWALAFAPILGAFLTGFVSGASNVPYENLWFITIILNIALSYWDAKQLKDAGFENKILDNAWFIPGYLWERGKILKENPIYLWFWIGTFILSILLEG